jgi:predicted DNA-binding transcriptional regulator AlpA
MRDTMAIQTNIPDTQGPATTPGLEPEQVAAPVAAHLAGVSEATWWRLHAAGKIPRPNKLGGRTLWRVRELRAWIAAGCTHRETWEAFDSQGTTLKKT